MSDTDLPATAAFEEGRLPVDVIVVWDAAGGWHAATVYYRTGDGPMMVHPRWAEPLEWVIKPWEYFSERLRDGRGGNGYDYDVRGFEVATEEDIAPVITAWEAEAVAATHGPMGETAGTFLSDQPSGPSRIIPFVLLADDVGQGYLVTTGLLAGADPGEVHTEAGQPIDPVPFESTEHWQRNGAASWPLNPHVPYLVRWAGGTIRVVIDDDARFETVEILAGPDTVGQSPAAPNEGPQPTAKETPVGPTSAVLVERVPPPRWLSGPGLDEEVFEACQSKYGEDPNWGFAIPWMYRAVHSPSTHEPMPTAPDPPNIHPDALGYWTALLHMLVYSLGWARPDRTVDWRSRGGVHLDRRDLPAAGGVRDVDFVLEAVANAP